MSEWITITYQINDTTFITKRLIYYTGGYNE